MEYWVIEMHGYAYHDRVEQEKINHIGVNVCIFDMQNKDWLSLIWSIRRTISNFRQKMRTSFVEVFLDIKL